MTMANVVRMEKYKVYLSSPSKQKFALILMLKTYHVEPPALHFSAGKGDSVIFT